MSDSAVRCGATPAPPERLRPDRDGIFLDLDEITSSERETLADWFYVDVDSNMGWSSPSSATASHGRISVVLGRSSATAMSRADAV